MKIKVLKTDGTSEPYLHTKVLGTFHNALSLVEEYELSTAEQMAEAVTFYLYRTGQSTSISSDQIHQMIQSVLNSTGYTEAGTVLNQYRLNRRLFRKRLEVVSSREESNIWSKSRVVEDLVREVHINRLTARAVAGTVEEKVFRMGLTHIRTSLLREIVAQDMRAIVQAEKQLCAAL